MQTLMVKSGRSYRKATAAEIPEAHGFHSLAAFNMACPSLQAPTTTTNQHLREILAGRDYEVFMVLFLNNRHQLIEASELFRGTIDGASVYPREVAKEVLLKGAAAVILAHNHPSGIAEPSQVDEMITARLSQALALIDVRILDHIIIAGGRYTSFAERGLI
jgi:DNA repair protein RadC